MNRRVRAVLRKELREYRRRASIVAAMATIPVIFLVQPLVVVFTLPASSGGPVRHEHLLLYMLGIPALVPVLIAAYAVVGERQQGTLEPALSTPVRREEFLLGKALAVLLPSVAVAYTVYALFIACVGLFAAPAVLTALLQWPQVLAQVVFTPLIAGLSIWIGLGISARANDVRVSQQLGMLAALPIVVVTTSISFGAIHPSLRLAILLGAALVVLDTLGYRVVAPAFDRERLIVGTR
jgi:ABC-type Na+ efflux pump permease subunit